MTTNDDKGVYIQLDEDYSVQLHEDGSLELDHVSDNSARYTFPPEIVAQIVKAYLRLNLDEEEDQHT